MSNRNLVIALLVIVLFVVGMVGFSLTRGSKPKTSEQSQEQIKIKQLSPDDIGLSLTPRADKKAIIMEISKLDGVKSIEYVGDYESETIDPKSKESLIVLQGVGPSTIELRPNETSLKREILLGTCSKNVCRYHTGVKEVKFVIKINFKNGEIGSIEQKVIL